MSLAGQSFAQQVADFLPPRDRRLEVDSLDGIPALLRSGFYDRFYSPVPYYLAKDAGALSGIRTQIRATIHGTRYLELGWDAAGYRYRQGFQAKLRYTLKRFLAGRIETREIDRIRSLVEICDHEILTVSRHTRSMIELVMPGNVTARVGQLAPPVRTTDPPPLPKTGEISALQPGTYFLMVSANRLEKNAWRVVQALARHLPAGIPGNHFVFLGTDKAVRSSFQRELAGRKDVVCLDYVSADEYRALMANCYALVYPSLSEGFGYPPVEAMSYGRPSIVSGTTAMPTAYKGGILFVDPRSSREIAARIRLLAGDHALYNALVSEIPQQLTQLNVWFEESRGTTVDYITK